MVTRKAETPPRVAAVAATSTRAVPFAAWTMDMGGGHSYFAECGFIDAMLRCVRQGFVPMTLAEVESLELTQPKLWNLLDVELGGRAKMLVLFKHAG